MTQCLKLILPFKNTKVFSNTRNISILYFYFKKKNWFYSHAAPTVSNPIKAFYNLFSLLAIQTPAAPTWNSNCDGLILIPRLHHISTFPPCALEKAEIRERS